MRIIIAAIGKLKDPEERAICDRYLKRLGPSGKPVGIGSIDCVEFSESRDADVAARKTEEAARLLKASADCTLRIALDETGRTYESEAFARLLGKHANSGVKACAFLIGGPDGHGNEAIAACDFKLSLGAMTLPHGLARVVLIEQLYRATTILSGHPYHRS